MSRSKQAEAILLPILDICPLNQQVTPFCGPSVDMNSIYTITEESSICSWTNPKFPTQCPYHPQAQSFIGIDIAQGICII